MRKFLKRVLGGHRRRKLLRVVKSVGTLEEVLEKGLAHYVKAVGAERGCILLEQSGDSPRILHIGSSELAEKFPFSRAVVDAVLDEARGFHCFDSSQEEMPLESVSLKSTAARSFVCAPIRSCDQWYGVVYLDNPTVLGMFSEESLSDLEDFSQILAEAIHKRGLSEGKLSLPT